MAGHVFDNLIAPAILSILSIAVGYVVWLLKQQRAEQRQAAKEQKEAAELAEKELKAIKCGLMLELRRDILEDHERFCIKGEKMRPYEYENICEVHDAYKTLGGNGMTEKAFDEITKVHFATESEH